MIFRQNRNRLATLVNAMHSFSAQTSGTGDQNYGFYLEPALTYETSATAVNYPSALSNLSGIADGIRPVPDFNFTLRNPSFWVWMEDTRCHSSRSLL